MVHIFNRFRRGAAEDAAPVACLMTFCLGRHVSNDKVTDQQGAPSLFSCVIGFHVGRAEGNEVPGKDGFRGYAEHLEKCTHLPL